MYAPQYVIAEQRNEPVKWLTKTEQLYTYAGAILLFCCIGWLWGFRYEEFTDVYWNTLLSGILTGEPTGFFTNYWYHTFTSWGIAFLYAKLPQIPWYGGMLVFALLICTAFFFQIVWLVKKRGIVWFLVLILLPLWIGNVVSIQFTRVAYFTALFPLLLFAARQMISIEPAKFKSAWFILNVVMIWSALTRLETITLVFFQVFVFYILSGNTKTKLKALILYFLPALLVLLSLWVLINFDFNKSDSEYRKVRSFTNTLWDFGQNTSSFNLSDESDSVILYTAQQYFLNDPSVINESFFKKAGVLPKEKMPVSIEHYLNDWGIAKNKSVIFFEMIQNKQMALFGLNVLLLVIGFVVVSSPFRKMYFAMHAITWLMLIGIAVFMKMEDRILEPVAFTLFIFSVFFILQKSILINRKITVALATVTVAVLIYLSYTSYCGFSDKSRQYKLHQLYAAKVANETDNLFSGKLLIYNLWTYNLFFQGPLNVAFTPKESKVVSLDNGLLFMLPAYAAQTKKLFGTSYLKEIFQQCISRKEEIVFVSDNSRMELLQQYLKKVYAIDLKYRIVHPEAAINQPHIFLNWHTSFTFHYFQLE